MGQTTFTRWGCFFSIIFLFCITSLNAATWYVSTTGSPSGDGTSWGTAFDTIQAGIDAAVDGDIVDIADGVYTGDGNINLELSGKAITVRSASGEPERCVIRCQYDGRGFYMVDGEGQNTVIEGLTVSQGNAYYDATGDGYGGGFYCSASSPTVTNCVFSECRATRDGGGMFITGSSYPAITNCTFVENFLTDESYGSGGGLAVRSSGFPLVSSCLFQSNISAFGGGLHFEEESGAEVVDCIISENSARFGGGMSIEDDADPILVNCTFSRNKVEDVYSTGGAIRINTIAEIHILNCTFIKNSTVYRGGAISVYSNPFITNCTFYGNHADDIGGALYNGSGVIPKVTNSILWGDSPDEIANYVSSTPANPIVTYCDVQSGTGEDWFGTGCIDQDPLFVFTGFSAPDHLHLSPGSPCIDAGNNSPVGGLPDPDPNGTPRPLDGDGDSSPDSDMGVHEYNPDQPVIALSKSAIEFNLRLEGRDALTDTVSIGNAGGALLNWGISGKPSWLNVNPTSGQLSNGQEEAFTLTVDPAGLTWGVYTADLQVVDALAVNSPRVVRITLAVSNTLRVPQDYPTIQSAIDAALWPGDVVEVSDGVWTGEGNKNLDFQGKAITVCSASDNPELCIIDCEGVGRGFCFQTRETRASVVRGFTVRNGHIDAGAGIYVKNSSPTISKSKIVSNRSSGGGGGIYCWNANPMIDGCQLIDNESGSDGGGAYLSYFSGVIFRNCYFRGNNAYEDGGGLYIYQSEGASLINCTISGNFARLSGGGLTQQSCRPIIRNCILWGDWPDEIDRGTYSPDVQWSLIQNASGESWFGAGCLDTDPDFAFPDSYFILPGSPCVDAGSDTPDVELPSEDINGSSRFQDGNGDTVPTVDMGVYEYNPEVPALTVDSIHYDFYARDDSGAPAAQHMSLRNSSGCAMSWSISGQPSWLTLSPSSGMSNGEIQEITLSVNHAGMSSGTYSVELEVSSPGALTSPQIVLVTLHIGTSIDVPNDYPTIQEAIDAALPGSAIEVGDGTWSGAGNKNLDFGGKAITVCSASGDPKQCVIDCEQDGRGFYFHHDEDENAVVRGLTICNGRADYQSPGEEHGGAILCERSSPMIKDCIFTNNIAEEYESYGGAIAVYNRSSPIVMNCEFSYNRAGGSYSFGGAIYSHWLSNPYISDCTFSNNRAPSGGAVYINDASSSAFIHCVFHKNMAFRGSGIYGSGCTLLIDQCRFEDNLAITYDGDGEGAGVYFVDASVTLTKSVFRGNYACGEGGAVNIGNGDLYIADTLVIDNAAGGTGGGIDATSAIADVVNSTFCQNSSSSDGGGVSCDSSSDTSLTHCTFYDNEAMGTGGGLCMSDTATVSVENSIFWGDLPNGIGRRSTSIYPIVEYSLVQSASSSSWFGTGCIDTDPLFMQPDFEAPGCVRLSASSPCIDAGTDMPIAGLPSSDPDGNPRNLDGDGDGSAYPDMGAYEFNKDAPVLVLSATEILFSVPSVENSSEAQVLTIANAGGSILGWDISGQPAWLSISPSSGMTIQETDILLDVNPQGLAPGCYSAELTVLAVGAVLSPVNVDVDLYVTTTHRVPDDFPTIRDAIDASIDGDVIEIAEGVWTGPGNRDLDFLGKAITLRGAPSDASLCVIDCEQQGRGVIFQNHEGRDSRLEFLTIRNGVAGYVDFYTKRDGGGCLCIGASPLLKNCSFMNNSAEDYGGGMSCKYLSRPEIVNSAFSENSAGRNGAGLCSRYFSDVSICDTKFTLNSAIGSGGGLTIFDSTLDLVRCDFESNISGGSGGGVYSASSKVLLTDSRFISNTASSNGGGLFVAPSGYSASPTDSVIVNSLFVQNSATNEGGGIYNYRFSPTIANCLFYENSSTRGGGLSNQESSSPTITNCTFYDNYASPGAGMYNKNSSSPIISNCILWANTPVEISNSSYSNPIVTWSIVRDSTGEPWFGEGCLDADPLFVDPDGPDDDPATWIDNDYRLAAYSPAIDAGNNEAVPYDIVDLDNDGDVDEMLPFGLDGFTRFIDDPRVSDTGNGSAPIVDMGAYEYQAPLLGDIDLDWDVDLDDLVLFVDCLGGPDVTEPPAGVNPTQFALADLDGDGDVDLRDFAIFQQVF